MPPTINANDLIPGDRVVLRMQKARRGPIPIAATFEQFHDPASLVAKMRMPGTMVVSNEKWDKALRSGRRLAAFRVTRVVGIFEVDSEGRLWDEENRDIQILSREAAHG